MDSQFSASCVPQWCVKAGLAGLLMSLHVCVQAQPAGAPLPAGDDVKTTDLDEDSDTQATRPCQGIKETRSPPADAKLKSAKARADGKFATRRSTACAGINPDQASMLGLSSRQISRADSVTASGQCKGESGTIRFLAHQETTLAFATQAEGGKFSVDLPFERMLLHSGAVTIAAVCPDGSLLRADAELAD